MIPVSVLVTGKATVSEKIKGRYGRGRPSRFTTVYRPVVFWNITYRCNLRCKHCYIAASQDPLVEKKELGMERVLGVAEEMVELGIPLVVFTGGEPLMSEKFWRAAELLSKHPRPKLALSTNGTLITRDVASRFRELGFTYIGVSLDSHDPRLHDEFRGVPGAFEAAVRGIRNAVEEGLDVGIRITVTRSNIGSVDKLLELAARLGARRVSIYILDTAGRGKEILGELPTHEQLRRFAEDLVGLAKKYEGVLEILVVRANFIGIHIAAMLSRTREEFLENLEVIEAQGDCGRKTVSIYPDGTVRPCQFLEGVVVGDLRRERLRDILSPSNPRLKPFTALHERLRGPRCSQCPFRRICGGGSRNRALVVNGDFWGDEPLCYIDYRGIAEKYGLDGEPL